MSTYYVPSPVLSTVDLSVTKTYKNPCLLIDCVRQAINKINKQIIWSLSECDHMGNNRAG